MPFPRLLVVDDDEIVRSGIIGLLEDHGPEIVECGSIHDATRFLERSSVDVILCDLYLQDGTGLDLIRRVRDLRKDSVIVVMSGNPELPDVISALRLHATDFLRKPFGRTQLLDVVNTAHETLLQQRHLSSRLQELSSEIERKSEKLRQALFALEATQRSSLEALVVALDARERELCAHSFRVRTYTTHLALCAGYPPELIAEFGTAALLHDVGKIAIPDAVLLKPGPLTCEEFDMCKKHTVVGAQILGAIPSLWRVAQIVKHHHERWDGTGYPDGLRGDDIPLGARIFTIADALDALTSDRCYRKGTSLDNAQREILRCAGSQFDPELTKVFESVSAEQWLELRASSEQAFFSGPGNLSEFDRILSDIQGPESDSGPVVQ